MDTRTDTVSQQTVRSEWLTNLVNGLVKTLNPKNIWHEATEWNTFEWVLLSILLVAQAAAFIISGDYSTMGWVALVTGISTILCLVLVNKGRITNYFWGFVSSATWLVVAFHNWLIGDIFSQSFYVVMQIFGIIAWAKMMNDQDDKSVVKPRKLTPLLVFLSIAGTLAIYAIVVSISISADGNQVWLDGTLLPLGIAGQVLMTFGYRSQWAAWIVLDVVNVVIWSNQLASGGVAALSMLILQIVMLVNCLYGTWCWFSPESSVVDSPTLGDVLRNEEEDVVNDANE